MAAAHPSLSLGDELEAFIEDIENGRNESTKAALNQNHKLLDAKSKETQWTPLVAAIKAENVEIVAFLIEKGANVDRKCGKRFKEPPLFHAVAKKNEEILDILLEKCDVNIQVGEREYTALHEAVETDNKMAVKKLVQHPKIKSNSLDKKKNTPLHISVEKDDPDIVKILLDNLPGIDFNLTNTDGLKAYMVNTQGRNQTGRLVKEKMGMTNKRRQPCESPSVRPQHRVPQPAESSSVGVQEKSPPSTPESSTETPPFNQDTPPPPFKRNESVAIADNLRSLNESSLPPDVSPVGQNMCLSLNKTDEGTFDCHSIEEESPRSKLADGSEERYKPSEDGYAMQRPLDMGSIPLNTQTDCRSVAIPNESSHSPTKQYHLPTPVNQITDVQEQPTVEALRHEHIEDLSCMLDPPSDIGNYRELGTSIFGDDDTLLEQVNRLYLAHFGGGSPANAFLTYLQTDCFSSEQFVHIARILDRGDIVELFEGIDQEVSFDNLDQILISRIANKLEVNAYGVNDWREFSRLCDCPDEQIVQFATSVGEKFMRSPTESLISLLRHNKPDFTLRELCSHLQNIGRNDGVSYLEGRFP